MVAPRRQRSSQWEYGIKHHLRSIFDEPHRSGMTLAEAETWMRLWAEDGGNPNAFSIIRRPKGHWEEML